MSAFHSVFRSLPKLLFASLAVGVGAGESRASGGHGGGGHGGSGGAAHGVGGHGGGAGHTGAFHGGYGHGYHGWYGRGYGYYGYPYGFYGFGLGLGLGYGLGYGYGYGYGYPYSGYPYYGSPYYGGYPYYGSYPYGPDYPLATSNPAPAPGGSAPGGNLLPDPLIPSSTLPTSSGRGASAPTLRLLDSELELVVHVPADATVWVNGVKTTQTGTRREFLSVGVTPGRSYTYRVRAQWVRSNGTAADNERSVTLHAGERRVIDFAGVPVLPGEARPQVTREPVSAGQ